MIEKAHMTRPMCQSCRHYHPPPPRAEDPVGRFEPLCARPAKDMVTGETGPLWKLAGADLGSCLYQRTPPVMGADRFLCLGRYFIPRMMPIPQMAAHGITGWVIHRNPNKEPTHG